MASPVPLTVMSSRSGQANSAYVVIGNNSLYQQPPNGAWAYWFVVVDASNLQVVYNQLQTAPNVVPNLGPYNAPGYILMMATLGVGLDQQPQGALFNFLMDNGAGAQLLAVEQIAQQIGCGSLGSFAYSLVTSLGSSGNPGFEAYDVTSPYYAAILTLQLQPVPQPGGGVVYTPIELGDS